ncbi:Uncharacterised protein [Mycobacterium tuberculosis]|nr:Uncharacterised protein [Mycobacterium tuberculosis]CNL55721.1 Uncharacterised protein [Mycobacterium tuberculosis]
MRTLSASASMFDDVSTSSAVIGPSARSESRCAILAAASSSSLGSSLKMPPGDLPVTIAQVAKVTRSAASRGGTSTLSAGPVGFGCSPFCGDGSATPASESTGSVLPTLPCSNSAWARAISSAVWVFWCSCSCCTSSRCSTAYSISFSTL